MPVNKWKWAIDPEGFRILLRDIYSRYQVPIIITENGIGGAEELTEEKKFTIIIG
uniref:CAZy families GH1 protein n=1 Tax=uncultured Geobacillus sp. TaxID=228952 RepID=A0A060C5Z6_9BACL|nr:CAZy families GH1 protein [uncultured Geobacillus sp.]